MKIDLNGAETRQIIKGYGASACWWSQNVAEEKTAKELCALLYGKDGLGLSIYRYNLGAGWDEENCRVSDPWRRCESFFVPDEGEDAAGGKYDFTRDKNAYAFMKRCVKDGTADTVILFANSPHYAFTSSGQASGSLIHHTCNLPLSNYERYADYFMDITQHFIEDGIPVKYISPINEPQWKWGGKTVWQEGCHYEPEEVKQVFHIFAEKLEERNLNGVYLYGPESGEIGGLTGEYLRLFKSDRLIMKHLGVFAIHSYHADEDLAIRREFYRNTVLRNKDIRFDMSEWCELPCVHDINSMESALIAARVIGRDLCDLGAQSWTAWVAVNQIADLRGDGLDYSDGLLSASGGFSHYRICKRYYALKHFTKFAPAGSTVLGESKNENALRVFLFQAPDGCKTMIAVNEGESTALEIGGEYKTADIAVTDSQNDFAYTCGAGFDGSITLKARTITSLRFYGEENGD